MIEIPVYSLDGKQTDTIKVDEALLGGEVRPSLLKQAYVMYHANRRQGSATTRNRAQTAGSTRKLYKQKGTGRARRGPVRTNIMRGGGVAHAKHPRDFRKDMPVKMRRLATRNALLAKLVDNEVKVVDGFDFAEPKTKRFAGILEALKIDRTCLLALDGAEGSTSTWLSARNVASVQVIRVDQLNAYDLLSRRFLLVDKTTLASWLDAQKPARDVEEAA